MTTPAFLSQFGFETLRDLPEFEKLEDAGLLSKDRLLAGEIPVGIDDGEAMQDSRDDSIDEADAVDGLEP